MTTPTVRVWESHLAVYRHIWHGHVLLAFVQPTLYLVGFGLGVGTLVDESVESTVELGGISYFSFLAPALLATTAMISRRTWLALLLPACCWPRISSLTSVSCI